MANPFGVMTLLPERLSRPPLQEAVFEVRFEPAVESVVSLLPGLLFARLGGEYSRSESLPLASLPLEFRRSQPNLRYQQQVRLSGDTASVFIGDWVAGVSSLAPYPGWEVFRARILKFLDVLQSSGLVRRVERVSMKFVNVLSNLPSPALDALQLRIEVAGEPASENGLHLRTEIRDERYVRIIEIAPQTKLRSAAGTLIEGLLLSLDSIQELVGHDFWTDRVELVDALHDDARQLFFRLLVPETIDRLGPVYPTTRNNQ